ncbi:MAG: phosphoglycerate kinase, partial [Pseudomonadota bacterium]|nr:phosphoglycerate kinase [Pseudomonadota bacterium]
MFKTIDQHDVSGKKVLVRADLNVPMHDGEVTDATRLERLAPTIVELLHRGARVIIASHFGRPEGGRRSGLTMASLCGPLSGVLGGRNVVFANDCIGPEARKVIDAA